jgi:predicted AAA+ superfamily ATPase
MAWKQQHNIYYEDKVASTGNIYTHKQTVVDLEYFVNDLRNKEHDMAIFIDTTQHEKNDAIYQATTSISSLKIGSILTEG